MRASVFLIAFVIGAGIGHAFTNGTILPGYLCNPGQGLPTSLGGVLQILNKTMPTVASVIATIHHQTSLISQNNLVQVANLTTPKTNMVVESLMSGCKYRLSVASMGGEVINGLIIYATNGETLYKRGQFTEHGPAMVNWPACGPGMVGAVHKEVVETPVYTGLVWEAPRVDVPGRILFQGVTDTDNGFGPWTNNIVYELLPRDELLSCPE